MTLPASTIRRLTRLPQPPGVWEGAWHTMVDPEDEKNQRTYLIWLDSSLPSVRAMEMIDTPVTPELMTRLLIQAMENPQGMAEGSLPEKIKVNDRELQFFLRGALKDLAIDVTYADELPFSNELFHHLESWRGKSPEPIPELCQPAIDDVVDRLWKAAPWENILDSYIFRIASTSLDACFFATVLGFAGEEFGILFYRDLESLIDFQRNVFESEGLADAEAAFLRQNCIFVTFDLQGEDDDDDLLFLPMISHQPQENVTVTSSFGSIHPLEGLRPYLDDEEAEMLYMATDAFLKFWQKNKSKINESSFPPLETPAKVSHPLTRKKNDWVVSTMPEMTDRLQAIGFSHNDSLLGELPNDRFPVPISPPLSILTLCQRMPLSTWEAVQWIG